MAEHSVKVVPRTTAIATKAIFDLHPFEGVGEDIKNDDVLNLSAKRGILLIVNKDGIELGRFPTGHPLNKPELLPLLKVETYKVIGRLDNPTRPRLHLTISQKDTK